MVLSEHKTLQMVPKAGLFTHHCVVMGGDLRRALNGKTS